MDEPLALRDELRIALRIAALRIRGQMAYRASFWMQIFSSFIVHLAELIALLAMFTRFEAMGGWTLGEVALLHGISMTAFSIADTIAVGLDSVPAQVRHGEFDRVLTRPLSSWIQTIVSEVSLRHLGLLPQGIVMLGVSIALVDVRWTPGKALFLPIVIASGVGLYVALFTVMAILSFWTVNAVEAVNAFTYGGRNLGQFPLHIFDRWLRRVFIWIVPVGFTAYFPALYLLDKRDPLGMPGFFPFIGPAVAALFCLVVAWGWRLGIRHYRSTGS